MLVRMMPVRGSRGLNHLNLSGNCMYTTFYNNQYLCILPTECIYGFHMILSINNNLFP
jgi:hypothetical protein